MGAAVPDATRRYICAVRLHLPPVTIDLNSGVVRRPGGQELLRAQEAALLRWLASHPGETWSRDALLAEVWGYGPKVRSRTLDTTLSRLRGKVEADPKVPRYLLTVPGAGVRLELPDDRLFTVGRREERAEIASALDAHRIVTLVGLGGAGKTHLAREFCAARFGVFCDAAPTASESDLVRAIGAAVLGAWSEATATRAALHEAVDIVRPGLLVVDNVEQVVTSAAALVAELVARHPELQVLVTSRVPLRIAGEAVVDIAGLSPADAAALYAHRVGAPVDDPALSAVLERVDRLPLAVEMVAAWDGFVALAELEARLGERADLLVSQRRDRPERHQSMAAVLDDAVGRLSVAERSTLERLTVFSGAFGLGDAEAVAGATAALHLRGLCERSLATRTVAGDFRLRALVRAHIGADAAPSEAWTLLASHFATPAGRARLFASPADGLAAARGALAAGDDVCAAACLRAAAGVPGVDIEVCDPLLDHLAGAVPAGMAAELRLEQARLRWRAGRLALARTVLTPLLEAHDAGLATQAQLLRGAIERDAGDPSAALAAFDRALASAPSGALRGRALAARAFLLGRLGQTEAGIAAATEALEALRGGDDRASLAFALRTLAALRRETSAGDLGHNTEALHIYRALGDRRSEALVLGALAVGHMDAGDLERARDDLDRALARLRSIGSGHLAAVTLANRAFVDRLGGRPDDARAAYLEALVTLRSHGDPVHQSLVLGNLGELALEAGQVPRARALLAEAVSLAERVGFAKLEGLFRASLGLARARLGEAGSAADLARGEAILRDGGFQDALCCALATRAHAALAADDPVAAAAFVRASRAASPGIPWVDAYWQRAEAALAASGA